MSVAGGRSGPHGDRSGLFFDFANLFKSKAITVNVAFEVACALLISTLAEAMEV